ncbi:hypothetical protein ACN1SV_003657 [Vibrio cholerae]|uniref:hypothetical protein n=1 Tax=Vibrio cholerae TaxID=666 RepID=UPI0013B36479|nr:hypothetical protein [Vibrio cholerae]EJL6539184.1 hypothetical protein [Vibrio cholerae]
MFNNFWKHPVVSSVASGLILAAITAAGTYILGYWSWLKNIVFNMFLFLTLPLALPVWLVSILAIFTVVTILKLIFSKIYNIKPKQSFSLSDYNKDTFWGVEWNWSYIGGRIDRLVALCPHCKYELVSEQNYQNYRETKYKCNDCGYVVSISGESDFDVRQNVCQKVKQKMRTGAWSQQN